MPEEQPAAIPAAAEGRTVWLEVGALFDGTGSAPVPGAHVVYDAASILYVGAADAPPPPGLRGAGRAAPDARLPRHTLLPALIESHAHLFLEGGELDRARRAATLQLDAGSLLGAAQQRLERLARLGIGAVRDAGDRLGIGLVLARLSRSEGRPLMPAVESPGAAIHHRGRYGSFIARPLEDHPTLRACVRSRVMEGADRIKLIASGIVDFASGQVTQQPQMTGAEVAALVAAAADFGRQTFAHASGEKGIGNVIEGGVGSVEHGLFITPDQLARMRERRIAWTPTFAPVRAQLDNAERLGLDAHTVSGLRRILDDHARQLVRAHEIGVPLLAGSDAGSQGVPHGLGLLAELELMEEAGLPPAAVLTAATGGASAYLSTGTSFGRVVAGAPSRFMLTRHSPLAGIANLRKDRIVVIDGIPYPTAPSMDMEGL